jgi:predicted nicotinamide N-methyase
VQTAPDILLGRRVRRVDVHVAAGLVVPVLEADAEVVLEESVQGTDDACAATLWPTAIAAASRLPDIVRAGMHVLDIGAGTGVVALTAARLGARATALVYDEFCRAMIARAAEMDEVEVEVRDWDVAGEDALPQGDVVVFADLLYEPTLARAAARRTLEALAFGGTVLVSDPGRFARTEFVRVLATAGVDVSFDDVLVRPPGDAHPARVAVALLRPPG